MASLYSYYYKVAGRASLSFPFIFANSNYTLRALTANVLYWGGKKEGYHTDEMFSYAQIGDTEYWRIWFDRPGEPYLNYWHDPSYYETFLTVSADEAFDLAGAWNTACDNDAHPPLYFVMLELVTSLFFQDHFTKWSGLVTNLPFFILNLILVYLLAKKLFGPRLLPCLAVVFLYGMSTGAVNSVVYMRMYMMLTFFSSLFFYVHCLLFEHIFIEGAGSKRLAGLSLLVFLAILGGVLTQYYFLIFAFFPCLFFGLGLLLRKRWLPALLYGGCAISPIVLCVFICPDFIDDLFFSLRGAEALSNASSSNNWQTWCMSFSALLNIATRALFGSYGHFLLAALLLLLVVFFLRRSFALHLLHGDQPGRFTVQIQRRQPDAPPRTSPQVSFGVVWQAVFVGFLFLSVLCFVGVIALIAPDAGYMMERYIMCAFPAIVLIVFYFIYHLLMRVTRAKPVHLAVGCLLAAIVLSGYVLPGVHYLYPGVEEHIRTLEQLPETQAIVITDDNDGWSPTVIMPYLLCSRSVYHTLVGGLPSLDTIQPEPSEQMLLYIRMILPLSDEEPDEERIADCLDQVKGYLHPTDLIPLFRTSGSNRFYVYALCF